MCILCQRKTTFVWSFNREERLLLKSIGKVFLLVVVVFIFSIYFLYHEEEDLLRDDNSVNQVKDSTISLKKDNNSGYEKQTEGVSLLIGNNKEEILNKYGKPARVDLSAYGYEWWIYNQSDETYMQVAIEDDQVVSVYALGNDINVAPFEIGQKVNQLYVNSEFNPETSIDIQVDDNSYRFELSEEDIGMQPLIPLGDIYAQVIIDKFLGEVAGIRFLNAETLIKLKPYELIYRGQLPKNPELSEEEWLRIEQGNDEQIFEITNIVRSKFNLNKVEWDENTAEVAFSHSLDMFEGGYFAHESPTKGDLGDRLQDGDVSFQRAGENIAAKYVDGIAAFAGWMNSKGHRDTLLNEEFTHLGVGVYREYYTQNFIKKFK